MSRVKSRDNKATELRLVEVFRADEITGWRRRARRYYRDDHIREIAEYCESDVLNTYRVWLRYELFRGRLSDAEFQASEVNLIEFVRARGNTNSHLTELM
jgi:hypothetical protein